MLAVIQFALVLSRTAGQRAEGALSCLKRVESSERQRDARSARASLRILVAVASAAALAGCGQADTEPRQVAAESPAAPGQPLVVSQPEDTAAPPASPRRFTKQEFAQHIQGMTKADIRREFGPPLVVHDDTDSWYYSDLPVYDADAGIQVSLTIRFMGLTPAEADEVLEVSY